jgi:hypothetical protein
MRILIVLLLQSVEVDPYYGDPIYNVDLEVFVEKVIIDRLYENWCYAGSQ